MRYAQVYRCDSRSHTDWEPYWVEMPGSDTAPVERYGVFVYATDTTAAAEVATVMVALFERSYGGT